MYARILCPIDGSATSNRAVDEALDLATALRSEIRFIHVVDLYFTLSVFGDRDPSDSVLKPFRSAGDELLSRTVGMAGARHITASASLIDAPRHRAATEIVHECSRWNAEVIVIGTHGRRGLARALMGSDAEAIVSTAPVPVLLVRGSPSRSET